MVEASFRVCNNRHACEDGPIAAQVYSSKRFFLGLSVVYLLVAALSGLILSLSGVLARQELQSINRLFEARPWFIWSDSFKKRLNPQFLWQYHQEHEIPRQWWAWDYTLSWLLQDNHPPLSQKIVIFNHLFEDEPPVEAVRQFPWMKPLLQHPLPRKTVAEMIDFLVSCQVRLIILDNDFPQYTGDDQVLAKAIRNAAQKNIPVLMVRTINRQTVGNVMQLEVPTQPSGVLQELSKLEPGVDVVSKYTGITGTIPDEDQVVRRIALELPGPLGKKHESVVIKALRTTGSTLPEKIPAVIDIDFAGPANSGIYPVRPLSYLLDPEQKKELLPGRATTPALPAQPTSQDVSPSNAIVIIGDGIVDVFNTPLTNEGVNSMSGSEILANSLDTLSRGHWPVRLSLSQALTYCCLLSLFAALGWSSWRLWRRGHSGHGPRLIRALPDLVCFAAIILSPVLLAYSTFSISGIILPIFVPAAALIAGSVAATMWEREQEREETFAVKLQSAQEKLQLAQERYEADLKRQEAEAHNRELLSDQKLRQEFVRRINHDLNAPVSVLNWTLAEMHQPEQEMESVVVQEKIGRLVKTSDKLCELIDQLVQSYDYETDITTVTPAVPCDLNQILSDSVELQQQLAHLHNSTLSSPSTNDSVWVKGSVLDFSRIIDNLIRNAIKHNPPNTKVEAVVFAKDSSAILTVSDTGCGIAAEHLPHLFEAGYRVKPESTPGQGLGLDIVKTLVEKASGSISVTSGTGKGTTFTVTFPQHTQHEQRAENQRFDHSQSSSDSEDKTQS